MAVKQRFVLFEVAFSAKVDPDVSAQRIVDLLRTSTIAGPPRINEVFEFVAPSLSEIHWCGPPASAQFGGFHYALEVLSGRVALYYFP